MAFEINDIHPLTDEDSCSDNSLSSADQIKPSENASDSRPHLSRLFSYVLDFDDCNEDTEASNALNVDVLTLEELERRMNEVITSLNQVVDIPADELRLHLNDYKWERDSFISDFYEGKCKTLFISGLCNKSNELRAKAEQSTQIQSQAGLASGEPEDDLICPICCSEGELIGMSCGHLFCTLCWKTYISSLSLHCGRRDRVFCPSDCKFILSEESLHQLAGDNKILQRDVKSMILGTFVRNSPNLIWCVGLGCGNVILIPESALASPHLIRCPNCTTEFCSRCTETWHDPVPCSMFRDWLSSMDRDENSFAWITVKTKPCPSCGAKIEKDGGCDHMMCLNIHCNYEFCWVCLEKFDHKSCPGSPNAEKHKDIERYFYHFSSFDNHKQALESESKLYETIKRENMGTVNPRLHSLFTTLDSCRRNLMYAHCFIYYLEENNDKSILEYNLSIFEEEFGNLVSFLDDLNNTSEMEAKIFKMLGSINRCEERRQNLIKQIKEGYNSRRWLFCKKFVH